MKQRPNRILMISEHADPLAQPGAKETGGQNVYVYHLAKELSKRGWWVDVFTRWDKRNKKQVVPFAKRARVIRIVSGPKYYIPRDHLFKYLPDFVDGIISFKNENKLSYNLIHSHYWMSGWSGLKLSQLWHIPLTTTFHSLGYVRFHALRHFKEHSIDNDFFKFRVKWEKTLAMEGKVLSTSPFEKKDLINHYDAPAEHISIIPAGIDLKVFRHVDKQAARKKIGLPPEAVAILYVGRIEWRKGIGTLIYALPTLLKIQPNLKNKLKVLIVGRKSSGPEFDEVKRLKEIARNLGISKYVQFLGSKERTDMKYYYSAADVCAVPSYYEPFGLVPLEAFACYCPVVASKIGGLQYTIKNKHTGLLVAPRHPKALAKAINAVISDRDRFLFSVKQFARTELRSRFSWEAISQEMIQYYDKLLKENVES